MSDLRKSQLETLRAVQSLDGERGKPGAIGGIINASLRATKERCDRLVGRGLYAQLDLDRHGRYFRSEYGLSRTGKKLLAAERPDRAEEGGEG